MMHGETSQDREALGLTDTHGALSKEFTKKQTHRQQKQVKDSMAKSGRKQVNKNNYSADVEPLTGSLSQNQRSSIHQIQ